MSYCEQQVTSNPKIRIKGHEKESNWSYLSRNNLILISNDTNKITVQIIFLLDFTI